MREPTAEEHEPGLVTSALTLLRLIAGWSGTALGLLDLSMGIDTGPGTADWPYLVFHVVLVVAGVVLLAFGALPKRPGRAGYAAGLTVAALGPLVSIVAGDGYPFPMTAGRHVISDVIFWGGVGFLVLVLVTLRWPAPAAATAAREPRHATHSEERTPAPRDENVGGLP
jgi:hypothetical protein